MRPVEALGHFEELHVARRFEIPRATALYGGIARLLLDERQPARFELGTGAHHQRGASSACDEARPRFDAMRILPRGGSDVDVAFFAGELLRKRAPLGLARENIERGHRSAAYEKHRRSAKRACRAAHCVVVHATLLSEPVRAVRPEAVHVLQDQLIVGRTRA
jgi:hypothetical protein